MAIELELRRKAGQQPAMEEYLQRFPDDRTIVQSVFMPEMEMARTKDKARDTELEPAVEGPLPQRLGRYLIEKRRSAFSEDKKILAFDVWTIKGRPSSSWTS